MNINRMRISAGINQVILSNLFISLGAGYAGNKIVVDIDKYYYGSETAYDKTYGSIIGEDFDGAILTLGASYRLGHHLLILSDMNLMFKFRASMNVHRNRFSYYNTDINFGLGYQF